MTDRDLEYRVTWRWLDRNDPYPIRRKEYKTYSGAMRLVKKLESNNGTYEKLEDGTGIQTGELVVTKLKLDFVRVEVRDVEKWQTLE